MALDGGLNTHSNTGFGYAILRDAGLFRRVVVVGCLVFWALVFYALFA